MLRGLLAKVIPLRHARAPVDDPAVAGSGSGPPDASRRTLITRGLSVLAGAVSVSAAGAILQSGGRQAPTVAAVATTTALQEQPAQLPDIRPTELALFIRNVRAASPGQVPGRLPTAGAITAPHGQLVDPNGTVMGMFTGGVLPGSAGQIAFQRFVFPDGTLVGMGSGSLAGEEYAVVGGTGIYAGAIGTYQTKLQLGNQGKDAEFTFNITGVR